MENTDYERIGTTDVYLSETALVPTLIPDEAKAGHVGVVYFEDVEDIAFDVVSALKREKILVYECKIKKSENEEDDIKQIKSVPEYVRYLIGVGCGKINMLCSYFATINAIDYMMFVTAPSSDRILYSTPALKEACCPKYVVADRKILDAAPKTLIAAGWGIALSQPLKAFERCVAKKLGTENSGRAESIAESFKRELAGNSLQMTHDTGELFWFLMRLSDRNRKQNFKGGVDSFCEVMQKSYKLRHRGEYMFVASYVLWAYYRLFLKSRCEDTLLPPDKMKSMKLLETKCGLEFNLLLKRIDFLTINGYFRIKYILDEYREDLIGILDSIDLEKSQRRWRRLYEDAGFWLKENFTTKELLSIMALCGEISGGILGYAKASGALEDYI